jgi:hypothetical protein
MACRQTLKSSQVCFRRLDAYALCAADDCHDGSVFSIGSIHRKGTHRDAAAKDDDPTMDDRDGHRRTRLRGTVLWSRSSLGVLCRDDSSGTRFSDPRDPGRSTRARRTGPMTFAHRGCCHRPVLFPVFVLSRFRDRPCDPNSRSEATPIELRHRFGRIRARARSDVHRVESSLIKASFGVLCARRDGNVRIPPRVLLRRASGRRRAFE